MTAKPSRAEVFRARVEEHLGKVGFVPGRYVWTKGPSRLVLLVGDTLREIKLHAGMSRERLAYELGRIAAWGEMMGARA